jgi:transcriptional antiterminator RfaH
MRKWYVARVEPRADRLAEASLRRDNFDVFSPRLKSSPNHAGLTDTPLFPGYIFLTWNQDDEKWPTFKPEHRVYGFIEFGGEVPWLSDDLVQELAKNVDELNGDNGIWRRYRTGEQVWVNSPGLDCLAEVLEEAKSPQARARVLLHFMGRKVKAQVPWKDLRPVEYRLPERPRTPRRTRGHGRRIKGNGSQTLVNA